MGRVASHALLSSLNLILGAASCQLVSLLTDDNSRSGQGITVNGRIMSLSSCSTMWQ
jgi:hypothetical protein